MKKMIFLLLAATLTTGAFAQVSDKKTVTKKLENTIADKKEDKHEAGKDLKNLRLKKAVAERKEVRTHRRSIHRMGKHLRNRHGVKHPIYKAKRVVKEAKEARQGKD